MNPVEDIHIIYHFLHPRRKVFEAWTSNDAVIPPVTRHEIDLREGGRIKLFVEREDGVSIMSGLYKVVEKPVKLVYTWEWDESGEATTVTVLFREADGETEVTIDHTGFASEESRANHVYGWDSYLKQFREAL